VQLCKDIATAREAGMKALNNLRGLEGIHDIHGFRARVKELNQFNDVGLNLFECFRNRMQTDSFFDKE
jgi:hypothetical protein